MDLSISCTYHNRECIQKSSSNNMTLNILQSLRYRGLWLYDIELHTLIIVGRWIYYLHINCTDSKIKLAGTLVEIAGSNPIIKSWMSTMDMDVF